MTGSWRRKLRMTGKKSLNRQAGKRVSMLCLKLALVEGDVAPKEVQEAEGLDANANERPLLQKGR